MHRSRSTSGFTLIELLVVVAISALLSTVAILYSNVGRNAVALSIEESKISEIILQAKELSIATYTSGSASCGYGVTLNEASQTYSIFSYAPNGAASCPDVSTITGISSTAETEYTPGTWQIPIAQGVVLQAQNDSLQTILFYPPDPTVFLSRDGSTFIFPPSTLSIHLETTDQQNSATISVNPGGQVNF